MFGESGPGESSISGHRMAGVGRRLAAIAGGAFSRLAREWACFIGRCPEGEVSTGRVIDVEGPRGEVARRLQEFVTRCPHCERDKRYYSVIKEKQKNIERGVDRYFFNLYTANINAKHGRQEMEKQKFKIVQMIEGKMMASEIGEENLYPFMEIRGYAFDGYEMNPRLRKDLQGQPKFKGLIGPCYDRDADGKTVVRYEDYASYNLLSS